MYTWDVAMVDLRGTCICFLVCIAVEVRVMGLIYKLLVAHHVDG